MRFSLSEVEAALAARHLIADDKRSAFAGRLKHYQRQGFPPDINTGRGRAATYRVEHLCMLGMALELNQLGLTPERAIAVLTRNLKTIAAGIYLATNSGLKEENKPILFYFDPVVLTDLMDSNRAAYGFDFGLSCGPVDQYLEMIRRQVPNGLPRNAMFNVSSMLVDIGRIAVGYDGLVGFFENLREWAKAGFFEWVDGHGD